MLNLTSSSRDRHPIDERGQEAIKGVKSVDEKRKIRKNKQKDVWEVETTERTNLRFDNKEDAKQALKDVNRAMKEIEELPQEEKTEPKKANLNLTADQDNTKSWRGLRYDEETGVWEVYITKREVETFSTPEEALKYMQSGDVKVRQAGLRLTSVYLGSEPTMNQDDEGTVPEEYKRDYEGAFQAHGKVEHDNPLGPEIPSLSKDQMADSYTQGQGRNLEESGFYFNKQ